MSRSEPTARIAACGGSTRAWKRSTPERAEVGDAERAGEDLLGAQRARARGLGEAQALAREALERARVGVEDHGHGEAVVERQREADVDALVHDHAVVAVARVHARVLAQGAGAGHRDHVGQRGRVRAALERAPQLAQPRRRHVALQRELRDDGAHAHRAHRPAAQPRQLDAPARRPVPRRSST